MFNLSKNPGKELLIQVESFNPLPDLDIKPKTENVMDIL